MNGKTSKLLREYATRSGQKENLEDMKRSWYQMNGKERHAARNKLKIATNQLRLQAALKSEVEVTRSIRRKTEADGSRTLWFMREDGSGGSTASMKAGEVSYDGLDLKIRPEAFQRFWDVAVDDTW